jgi:acyl-CoA thioesterase
MSNPIFDLRPTHNPHRWLLPITEKICVGRKTAPFMLGGVGLAASVTALEQTSGRPVVWATAQYLSFGRPPAIVDLDVSIPTSGASTTQGRVIAHIADQEILTVLAALGERPSVGEGLWVEAPDAPPPELCRQAYAPGDEIAGILETLDVRIVQGRFRSEQLDGTPSPDGRMLLWIRPRKAPPRDTGSLAVIADYLPSAVCHALGKFVYATSLDNTLRMIKLAQTEWILCDMHIVAAHGGFAHGSLRMFSFEGELMAVGSQSMILRAKPPMRAIA